MVRLTFIVVLKKKNINLWAFLYKIKKFCSNKYFNYEVIFLTEKLFEYYLPITTKLKRTYNIRILNKKERNFLDDRTIHLISSEDILLITDLEDFDYKEFFENSSKLLNSNIDLGLVSDHKHQYVNTKYFYIKKDLLGYLSQISTSLRYAQNALLISKCLKIEPYFIVANRITFNDRLDQKIYYLLNKLFKDEKVYFLTQQNPKLGKSFFYKGKTFSPQNDLPLKSSALYQLSIMQKNLLALLLLGILALFLFNWHFTLVFLLAIFTLIYLFDLIFNFFLITKSYFSNPEIKISEQEIGENKVWPKYSVLCPLYKETEVVSQFVSAMRQLDYPENKLQVLFLLEEDDKNTIDYVRRLNLPKNFEILVVPDSQPKTKPKALNYGLLHAKGRYIVVYDAEDIPDPMQLKKAVLAFRHLPRNIYCIQAKLNYYNPYQNLLTRFFTAEYSVWFELTLTGLQTTKAPIPLGGTSNHFRLKDIKKLKGWDPFNVTEDADLGIRIFKLGFRTAVLDSTTMEEANSQIKNWLKQRSRWIKGYLQTYFVHLRDTKGFKKDLLGFISFNLVVGTKVLCMFINPIMWALTLAYFLFSNFTGNFIMSLFPAPVFYMAIFTLVIGNFIYFYSYMVGVVKREQWGLVIYSMFIPVYWLLLSVGAFYALWEFTLRPHHWNKTKHGLFLQSKNYHMEILPSQPETLSTEILETID